MRDFSDARSGRCFWAVAALSLLFILVGDFAPAIPHAMIGIPPCGQVSRPYGTPAATPIEADKLKIFVTPPTVTTRLFDPKNLPSDMPAMGPNEVAVTKSGFSARARISYIIEQTRARSARWTAWLDEVEVTTRLEIVIWLPTNYTPKEKDHEEGHRRISERVYGELADKTARQVAAKYVRMKLREFTFYDDSRKTAEEAVNRALQDVSSNWVKIVLGRADRLNDRFDELTDHGRNNRPVDDAINEIFNSERRSKADPEPAHGLYSPETDA